MGGRATSYANPRQQAEINFTSNDVIRLLRKAYLTVGSVFEHKPHMRDCHAWYQTARCQIRCRIDVCLRFRHVRISARLLNVHERYWYQPDIHQRKLSVMTRTCVLTFGRSNNSTKQIRFQWNYQFYDPIGTYVGYSQFFFIRVNGNEGTRFCSGSQLNVAGAFMQKHTFTFERRPLRYQI